MELRGNEILKRQCDHIRGVMQMALGPANSPAISTVLSEELSLIPIKTPEAPSSTPVE